MSRLVFPETPVADDNAYLAALAMRALKAAHWRRGWRNGLERDGGMPVRFAFWECPADCPCHDDEWWETT